LKRCRAGGFARDPIDETGLARLFGAVGGIDLVNPRNLPSALAAAIWISLVGKRKSQLHTLAPPRPANRFKRVRNRVVIVHGLAFGAQSMQTRFAEGVPESGRGLTAQLGHQRRAARRPAGG
jgi:hypothetical protein